MRPVILFVDDEVDVREAIADLLEFAGWSVAHAEDGQAALDWLAAHPAPAAILLDLKMPRLDGYAFRERQLADAALRAVPTVVFTADAHLDDSRSAALDGLPIVRKSAPFDELLDRLAQVARPDQPRDPRR